jgi:hypothetical protein
MTWLQSWIRTALGVGFVGMADAAETRFQSGPAPVALIELFTSEGCSSCPPAEAWLNALRNDAGLWRDFVPVAFHVDYWDRLGWKDILASKVFTTREHAYAARWNSSSVYTPCFVRNGAEWRPSEGSRDPKRRSVGTLRAAFDPENRRVPRQLPAGPADAW